MGREEQAEERVVLDAIFPDEITDLDEHSFRIEVGLDLPDADSEEGTTQATILLTVSLPESYPDAAPGLTLSHPPNAPKPPSLDLSSDGAGLLAALEPTVAESLGDAMIFNVAAALKDAAEQLCGERAAAVQAGRDAERADAEARENAKFHGERVTRERFLAWRQKFVAEQAADAERLREEEALVKKKTVKDEDKMTGRQLWERGMVGKGWEEEEEGGGEVPDAADSVERGVEGLKVDS